MTDTGWVGVRRGGWHLVTLPDELVLRDLLDVDVQADEDVFGFVQRFGQLVEPPDRLPYVDKARRKRPGNAIHVRELAVYVLTAQTLVRHWLAHEAGESVNRVWVDAGWYNDVAAEQSPAATVEPWNHFAYLLNAGLACSQPLLEVEFPKTARLTGVRFGAPRGDLYDAMCVQLFNIVTEGHPVLVCKNETCGRRFVRQQGRAEHEQNRTAGVLYCSAGCARAQAQREYRRRNSATNKDT